MSQFLREPGSIVLHWPDPTDGVALCGIAVPQNSRRIGRNDLLCGTCMTAWERLCTNVVTFPAVEAQFQNALAELPYSDYLNTAHWARLRAMALEHYGESCGLCSRTANLNVHHRTYDRRGREHINDLIVLCDDCHRRFHAVA